MIRDLLFSISFYFIISLKYTVHWLKKSFLSASPWTGCLSVSCTSVTQATVFDPRSSGIEYSGPEGEQFSSIRDCGPDTVTAHNTVKELEALARFLIFI